MEHQYTQTGSLLGAGMGASLSEAKTDKVGEPQCKSGASHPTNLALCVVCCHFLCITKVLTHWNRA